MASSKRGFHLRAAFQRFDKDGDGSVSHDELKVVINDILQGDISEDEMAAVIELFDPNGDGDIKYAEFRDLFYSISVDQEKQRKVCKLEKKEIDDAYIETSIIPHLMRDEYSELRLAHNNISDRGVNEISGALSGDKSHCSVIDLRHNNIGVKGAEDLGGALASNVYVSSLCMSFNSIGGIGAAQLCSSLEPTSAGFSSISLLELRHCEIDDEGGQAIGLSFRGNTALRVVSLCGNYIGDKGAAALAEALENERCMIESLNLANNCIGGQGCKVLGQSIRSSVELKELVLSGNPLGDLGVSAFAESLEGVEAPETSAGEEKKDAYEDTGTKKEDRLHLKHVSPKKAVEPSEMPRYCGLRILGLSGCRMTDNGIGDLGGSLRTNAVLQTLDVRCNELTDLGITSLARSLEENTCLRELYCGNNNFSVGGAMALGSMLQKNVSLLVLDVLGCNLSKGEAAAMLAEGLSKNECLHELNIARTQLTDDGLKIFITAVEQNMCLEKIFFHCNPLKKSSIAALNFALTRERKPAAKLLDNMEASRLEKRREMKAAELARKLKAAEAGGGGGVAQGEGRISEGTEEDLAALRKKKIHDVLEPGTKIWIPVSFGRRNNVLGKIEVESSTTLANAREKIVAELRLNGADDDFFFLSVNDGKSIDKAEEPKRQVTWDCGRHVMLRPVNWIEL